MYEVVTVEERDDLDARRQDVIVQLRDFGFDTLERRLGFGALAEQDDALYHVVVVDDMAVLSMNRLSIAAQPDLGTLSHNGNVLDTQCRSVLRFDDGVFDILDRSHETERAHVHLLQSRLDKAAARIYVIVCQLLLNLADVEA